MTSFLKNHKAAQRRPQLQLMGKYTFLRAKRRKANCFSHEPTDYGNAAHSSHDTSKMFLSI